MAYTWDTFGRTKYIASNAFYGVASKWLSNKEKTSYVAHYPDTLVGEMAHLHSAVTWEVTSYHTSSLLS